MWKMKIMTTSVADKTAELRAKTDRQLIRLIERSLDRALQTDDCAMEVSRSAQRLFSVAYGATNAERRRVETKLAEVASHSTAVFASVA